MSGYSNICLQDDTEQAIVSGTTTVFGIVTIATFGLQFWYIWIAPKTKRERSNEESKDIKLIRIVSLVTLALYSIGFIFIAVGLMECVNHICGFGGILNFLAMMGVLLVFSIRLYYTFDGTTFALSYKFTYYMSLISFVCIVACIIGAVLYLTDVLSRNIAGLMTLFVIFIIFFNAIGLLMFYIGKLNHVITVFIADFGMISQPQLAKLNKSMHSIMIVDDIADGSSATGGTSTKTREDLELTEYEMNMRALSQLIGDMSKYTILITTAMVTSSIMIIIAMVITASSDVSSVWFFLIQSFDNCVNSICLVLQFYYFKKHYSLCCNKIDIKCQHRITKQVNKRVATQTTLNYQLQRLPTGQIGMINNYNVDANPIQTEQPNLGTESNLKNNNGVTASIPVTTGDVGGAISLSATVLASNMSIGINDEQKSDISPTTHSSIKLVAQKSAKLQLNDV